MALDTAALALRHLLAQRVRSVEQLRVGTNCESPHSWAWVAPDGKFYEVPDHGTWALKHLDASQKEWIRQSPQLRDLWGSAGFVYPEAVNFIFENGYLEGPPQGLDRKLVQVLTPGLGAKALKLGLPNLSKGFWDPKADRLSKAEESFLQDSAESYAKAFQPGLVDLNSELNRKKASFWKSSSLYLVMRSMASRALQEAGWLMVSSAFAIGWKKFPTQAQFDTFFLESLKCWKAKGMHLNPDKEEFSYSQGDGHKDITLSQAIDEFASRKVRELLFGHFMEGKVELRDRDKRINDDAAAADAKWKAEHPQFDRPSFYPPRVPKFPAKPPVDRPIVRRPERFPKRGDLSPPLGYPGGPCHVMQRIDDALNGPIEDALIEKVENADDLTNPEANKIYKPEADRGATGTQFKKIVLTPHAQYRMDLRGITISQIRLALKGFHDHYSREKSRGSFIFKQLESELQFTREIKWVDKTSGITLVFVAMSLGGDMAARIITCYRAGEDEDRIDRSECGIFQGWAGDYEDTGHLFKPDSKRVLAMAKLADEFPGGIKTFGNPNSGNGTNETISVPTRDSPAADRDIPNFESTKPDNVPHRTNSLPGEESGNPVNDSNADGGMLTRRTMTSMDKEAWRRQWQSGKRRHRQHGQAKAKARAYYRRNKSKIRAKARMRHNRMKNNGAFKASERMRRRQNRHMISALMEMVTPETVVAQFLYEKEAAKFAPVTERGGRGNQRQREQLPQDKIKDHREYLRGKGRKKHDALVYYKQKCKPNSRCMKRRERIKEDPKRYERGSPQRVHKSSVLTAPDIAFTLGAEASLGYVHDLSPMTGMVTYLLDRNGTETLESMTVEVFLRVAFFLAEADIDAFFDLVDAELGDEAYELLSHEGVQECAGVLGIDPDSPEFLTKCRDYVGEDSLENMTVDQLDAIQESMVSDLIDGIGGNPHSSEEDFEDEEEADMIDDDENVYGIPYLEEGS